MATHLLDADIELQLTMERLSDHPGVASDHTQCSKVLENRLERIFRETLVDLINQSQDTDHIIEILKLCAVYRHLSNAVDRGDEAANHLNDIVVKMTEVNRYLRRQVIGLQCSR